MERAFEKAPLVLLSGPAGVGKTDLACQFGRHLGDTGSRTGSVLFTAFDHNTGLCRLLHEVGTTLEGIGFARLSLEQQRQRILDYVKTVPCLLIWDSFDNAFQDGLDQPQLGTLDAEERQELLDLLRDISDGPSWVLITCRDEGRINTVIEYGHEELRGLTDTDSQQLAGLMVDGAGGDAQGTGPDYLELLRLLKGNPHGDESRPPPPEAAHSRRVDPGRPAIRKKDGWRVRNPGRRLGLLLLPAVSQDQSSSAFLGFVTAACTSGCAHLHDAGGKRTYRSWGKRWDGVPAAPSLGRLLAVACLTPYPQAST